MGIQTKHPEATIAYDSSGNPKYTRGQPHYIIIDDNGDEIEVIETGPNTLRKIGPAKKTEAPVIAAAPKEEAPAVMPKEEAPRQEFRTEYVPAASNIKPPADVLPPRPTVPPEAKPQPTISPEAKPQPTISPEAISNIRDLLSVLAEVSAGLVEPKQTFGQKLLHPLEGRQLLQAALKKANSLAKEAIGLLGAGPDAFDAAAFQELSRRAKQAANDVYVVGTPLPREINKLNPINYLPGGGQKARDRRYAKKDGSVERLFDQFDNLLATYGIAPAVKMYRD